MEHQLWLSFEQRLRSLSTPFRPTAASSIATSSASSTGPSCTTGPPPGSAARSIGPSTPARSLCRPPAALCRRLELPDKTLPAADESLYAAGTPEVPVIQLTDFVKDVPDPASPEALAGLGMLPYRLAATGSTLRSVARHQQGSVSATRPSACPC